MTLQADLDELPVSQKTHLAQFGFDEANLRALAATLTGDAVVRRTERNRVRGAVRPPTAEMLRDLPDAGSTAHAELAALGSAALARGEVAFVVMAGGMATRMGGVVKALVPVTGTQTFLELRLRENAVLSAKAGRPIPLWLMTSDATDGPIRGALANAPKHVRTFVQNLSLRLTLAGDLFRSADGNTSAYATGHGDLPDALRRANLLREFRAEGGKIVWITNLDNLGATIDPAILGWFIAQEHPLAVEVCPKIKGDKGGIPIDLDGRMEVLEEFRLPPGFDPTSVRVFNTNTFLIRADALADTPFTWSYFEVEKKVEGTPAIQFERLLQEMTHALPSVALRISREGTSSRFMPVKDFDELAARRADLEAMLQARGLLGA
jgi:UTP--glucose-1-phosphate uridylyltransferase